MPEFQGEGYVTYMRIGNMVINDQDSVYALWLSCIGIGLNNIDDSKDGIGVFLKRIKYSQFSGPRRNSLVKILTENMISRV